MSDTTLPTKEKLEINIREINKMLEKLLTLTSKTISEEIESLIWNLRAELEMLAVKFKVVLENENGLEKWQNTFLTDLRGTSSTSKAIKILKESTMNSEDSMALFLKNPKESYIYFWKLKETISSVIPAFKQKKFVELSSNSENDVFEI